jgi:penicillin V acylase-like amidase (Ntn superfamily)
MTEGTVLTGNHTYDRTIYQTCMDLKNKIYYYRTYENSTIHGIPLQKEVMLNVYPLQPDDMSIE